MTTQDRQLGSPPPWRDAGPGVRSSPGGATAHGHLRHCPTGSGVSATLLADGAALAPDQAADDTGAATEFFTFSESGTLFVASPAVSVRVIAVGGGGGGGGQFGGGGGGGGTSQVETITLGPGEYAVQVGAGGLARALSR